MDSNLTTQNDTNERLIKLEKKIDYIIELLEPVNAHAPFVEDLKTACQQSRVLRSIIRVRDDTPQLALTSGSSETKEFQYL